MVWRGIDHAYLMNFAQLIEHVRDRTLDAALMQLALQQATEHQRQDTANHVDFDLLVGPGILGTQADVRSLGSDLYLIVPSQSVE